MSDKYLAYPEYKESGVEWLGRIPKDWIISKVRYLTECLDEQRVPLNAEQRGEIPGNYPYWGANGVVDYVGKWLFDEDLVLIGEDGAPFFDTNKDVAFNVSDKIWVNNHAHILRPKRGSVCGTFLKYALNRVDFHLYINGSTRDKLTQADLNNISLRLPSVEEQRTIAAFLDYETARIDRLIAQQQRLIELLKEKRQAVISHAVRTRASEGHIKLAYAINLLTGYPFASSGFKSTKDTHIPLLRGANVGVDQIKWDDVVYWDSEDCSHLDDYYLERGDIVFGMDRPWISSGARVAEITQHDTPCLLLQRVARIRAKANHFQSYIKLCLSSNEFRNYVEADLTGVSVPHISPDQIKGFLIRNLPYDEQVSVTNEVLQVLEKLNAVERAAFNAIELLQERRTALISAAVTGKIDLRGWTPPAEEVAA